MNESLNQKPTMGTQRVVTRLLEYVYYVYSERRVYYVPLDVFYDKLRILAYRDRIGHRRQRNNNI